MPGSFGYKRCCCVTDDYCGDGTRYAAIELGTAPQSPNCPVPPLAGNDGWDWADGTSGTMADGVGITASGHTGTGTIGGVGFDYSLDMGAEGDYVLYADNAGPITLTFTAPSGKRICAVTFGIGHGTFDTLTTYSATVTDTGGTLTNGSQSGTTASFTDCSLTNSSFSAFAAAGESITSVSVSHGGNAGGDYLFVGYVSLCLADGAPSQGVNDRDGNNLVDRGSNRIVWR